MSTSRVPFGRGESRDYETKFEDIPLTLVLKCAYKKCKHRTIVRLIKGASSHGYYHNKKYGTFDMRNVRFVCNDHQTSYDRWYRKRGYRKIYGWMFLNQTLA